MRFQLPLLAALACTITLASVASAHARLFSPPPRSAEFDLRTGPCGGVAATGTPTVYQGGAEVTITWLEEEFHGNRRLAMSPAGDAGFEQNILLDDIADPACDLPPCSYEATVTLPNVACANCTLQLIQYEDGDPAYFSCSDISVTVGATTPPPGKNPMGTPPDDEAPPATKSESGGCDNSGATQTLWFLALTIFLAAQTRRKTAA